MELLALKTFLAVVDEGSMLLAADKLNTVQSNVTARIKKLEKNLGIELFYREGKSLSLTPSGRMLIEYAQQMIKLEQQVVSLASDTGRSTGTLRLGTMEAFASFKLPSVLKVTLEEFPELNLHLETATSADLVKQVLEHKLDAAVVGGCINHPDLIVEELLNEELVLVQSNSDTTPPQNSLVLFKNGCAYRACALNWQRENGLQDYGLMELNTLDGILGCVSIGLGTTLMPRSLVMSSSYAAELSLKPLPKHISSVPTQLIRHKKMPELNFLDCLRDEVRRQYH